MLQQLELKYIHFRVVILTISKNCLVKIDSPISQNTNDKTQTFKFGRAENHRTQPNELDYHSVEHIYNYNTDNLILDSRFHEDGQPYKPCDYLFYITLPVNCRIIIEVI